jgi:hypothetical protein
VWARARGGVSVLRFQSFKVSESRHQPRVRVEAPEDGDLETCEPLKPCFSSCLTDVRRLRSFLTLGDLELYRVAFLQALVSLRGDRAVMNKNVGPIGAADEAVSFGVIEPLDGSFQAFHVPPLSARPLYQGGRTCIRSLPLRCILERSGMRVKSKSEVRSRKAEVCLRAAWARRFRRPCDAGAREYRKWFFHRGWFRW